MKDYKAMMRQVTLSDEKKEEIMDMLENQTFRTRRRPPAVRLALAVGCLLCIAAGWSSLAYRFTGGAWASITESEAHLGVGDRDYSPAEVRDGRLWFTADGQEADITELVDEDTPYIYTRTDPDTGGKGYVVVGGTPEDFGWAEFYTQGSIQFGVYADNVSETMWHFDGLEILESQLTEEQRDRVYTNIEGLPEGYMRLNPDSGAYPTTVYRPWLTAAMQQLGIRG